MLIEMAISDLERRLFWEQASEAMDRLRADQPAYQKYQSEQRGLDGWDRRPHRPLSPEEEEAW